MNLPHAIAAKMAGILGCPISSFPQPYLGLPLTPTKARLSYLQPLLECFDRYFVGWKGHLLNLRSRAVLVQAPYLKLSQLCHVFHPTPSRGH